MAAYSGPGLFVPHSRHNVATLAGFLRPVSAPSRPVCRPALLAPGPRASRRQRARLVTKNFKPSEERSEEAPVARPKPVRHPLTEDPFSGASPAETATQEVIFGGPGVAAVRGYLESTADAAVRWLSQPRELLRSLARNVCGPAAVLALFAAVLLKEHVAFWGFYCASLENNPIGTKVATGVVGTLVGDYIAQRVSHSNESRAAQQRDEAAPAFVFDIRRTMRLVAYTAVVNTPIGHWWFQLLDTYIMPDNMTSMTAVLTKMALDQLVMCPLSTAVFFMAMRCWEGHPQDALAYMRRKMVPTLTANYLLWPLAHMVNFAFVPPSQRILYCNAVGIAWTAILSSIQNAPMPPAPGTTAAAAAARGGGPGPFLGGGGAGAPSSTAPSGSGDAAGGFIGPARQLAASWRGPAAPAAGMRGSTGYSDEGHWQAPAKGRIGVAQPAGGSAAYMRFTKPGAGKGDA